jgi:group I intron endonuclease
MADAMICVGGIYAIRCTVNGKVYVGSAVNIKNRWAVHRHGLARGIHHGVLLQRAWNRHGADAFIFEVLEHVATATDLLLREQFWIDSLNAVPGGYNTAPVAGSTLGKTHGETARQKMSASHRVRLATPEGRAARSAQQKAVYAHAGKRAAQAEKARAAWLDDGFRAAATLRAVQQTSDAQWRADHSAKIKAAWTDPVRRAAMCEAMKGRASEKRQPVLLFGVRYESLTAAAAAHGRNRDWVKARMTSTP